MNNVEYYPIHSNGRMTGIYSINDAQSSNPTYAFGKDFAKKLSAATNNGQQNYYLISAGNKLFAQVELKLTVLCHLLLLKNRHLRIVKL